jgi:hypothetical protein
MMSAPLPEADGPNGVPLEHLLYGVPLPSEGGEEDTTDRPARARLFDDLPPPILEIDEDDPRLPELLYGFPSPSEGAVEESFVEPARSRKRPRKRPKGPPGAESAR